MVSANGEGPRPVGDNLNLEQMERAYIMHALQTSRGNRTEAAQKLGLSRRTLHRKIKVYQLENL
jgi:DNA-binding NtrC family response regulator